MVADEFALMATLAANAAVHVAIFAVEDAVTVHVGVNEVGDVIAVDVIGASLGLTQAETGDDGDGECHALEGRGVTDGFWFHGMLGTGVFL